VADLFARAQRPELIDVGICWQVDRTEDRDCFVAWSEFERDARVRQRFVHYSEATGPCLARHWAQQLMPSSADFYLQLDSHMRFVPHWDAVLRRYFARAAAVSAEPVLTAYPTGYELPNTLPSPDCAWTALVPSEFSARDCMLRSKGRNVVSATVGTVNRCAVVAAGMLFCRASLVRSGVLAYDADLPELFFGEESLLAARLFCAGADVFWPGAHIVYHLWSRAHRPNFRDLVDARKPILQWASSVRVFRALRMYFALPHAYATAPWASRRTEALSEVPERSQCDRAGAQRLLDALARECETLASELPAIEAVRRALREPASDEPLYASGVCVEQRRALDEYATLLGVDWSRGTVSQAAKDNGNASLFQENALAQLLAMVEENTRRR
jgi:hypothetical protein